MHLHSEKNDFAMSDIFVSVSFLEQQVFLAVLSWSETNNIGLDVMIRDDACSVSTRWYDVTETIKAEESTGIDGIPIKGGVNLDVTLAWKVIASYANGRNILFVKDLCYLTMACDRRTASTRQCTNINHHSIRSVHDTILESPKFLRPSANHWNASFVFQYFFNCGVVIYPIKVASPTVSAFFPIVHCLQAPLHVKEWNFISLSLQLRDLKAIGFNIAPFLITQIDKSQSQLNVLLPSLIRRCLPVSRISNLYHCYSNPFLEKYA